MRSAWMLALVACGSAFGAPAVVADTACPYYAVDIASFATCDGDRVARAASDTPDIEAPATEARAQPQPRAALAPNPQRAERRADAARARPRQR